MILCVRRRRCRLAIRAELLLIKSKIPVENRRRRWIRVGSSSYEVSLRYRRPEFHMRFSGQTHRYMLKQRLEAFKSKQKTIERDKFCNVSTSLSIVFSFSLCTVSILENKIEEITHEHEHRLQAKTTKHTSTILHLLQSSSSMNLSFSQFTSCVKH